MTRWDPRREAFERLGGRYEVRVLEPSPPAVNEGPWYADDPAAVGEVPPGRQVVTPTTAGDLTWDQLAQGDPDLAAWCAERWLGAWRDLRPLPPGLAMTRQSFHMLAEHVLAPARFAANGKIGLRWTRGGFGTPFFGDDRQVRVDGTELVVVEGDSERRAPLTTLGAAAEFVGVTLGEGTGVYEPTTSARPETVLQVDPEAAAFISDAFGFAASVLEQLRADARPDEQVSRVQLWPEHFDMAVELGNEAAGARATYGMSLGDAEHGVPYLYVSPWQPQQHDPFWADPAFGGASLRYGAIYSARKARDVALRFFREGRQRLARAISWQAIQALH